MKNYKEIDGWFDFENVYDFLIEKLPATGKFVEIGAWLGKSSSYLCDNAIGKDIHIVDTWKGSDNELETHHKLATQTDIYEVFLENMGNRPFTPYQMTSVDAAKKFDDESVDVIFIDGNHTYEFVNEDIQAWLPKLKKGGYIAGDDYRPESPPLFGVIQAVKENFGEDFTLMGPCWIHQKG